jgi:signal transduction histidine kinase
MEVAGKPVALQNGLELEPGQTDITLHYTALSFARPEAIHFRYRLQGFDQDWVPAGNRRDAFYTNLPPGDYRFDVQAINEDGVHSDRPASLQFTLKPQIWQHPAFPLVYLLAGALLFWLLLLISQRRVRRLTAQKAELIAVINERDNAQTKLSEANRELELRAAALTRSTAELEKFAYIVSHDLREPIRSIVSFTQLLSRRYSDQLDAIGQGYIDYAVEGAFAMRRSLDNLLAYLSITDHRTISDLVPMATAFEQAQSNLAPTIKSAGATITHDALPVLPGKPLEMSLLLENLLTNAIKFQPLGQRATVHLSAEQNTIEKTWHFTMTDNGIGIAHAHLERIFELFNRLNPGGEYLGTGVGLAICKRIVESHRGRIWAESTLGSGSRLHFILPG